MMSEDGDIGVAESNILWLSLLKQVEVGCEGKGGEMGFLQSLLKEMSELLSQFVALINNSCFVSAKINVADQKASDADIFIVDGLVCSLFGVTEPTAYVTLQDKAYLKLIRQNISSVTDQPLRDNDLAEYNYEELPGASFKEADGDDLDEETMPTSDIFERNNDEGEFGVIKVEELDEKDESLKSSKPSKKKIQRKCNKKKRINYGFDSEVQKLEALEKERERYRLKVLKIKTEPFTGKYESFYMCDQDTFDQMKVGRHPLKCPNCAVTFKRIDRIVYHWKKRVCAKHGPKGGSFWDTRKNQVTGLTEYFCAHPGCTAAPDHPKEVWKARYGVHGHWNKHHRDSVIEFTACGVCGEKFVTKSLLILHMATAHKSQDVEKFTCTLCGKELGDKRALAEHEKRHKGGEKNFACEFCGNKYVSKKTCQSHKMSMHAAEMGVTPKKHVCHECGKDFSRPHNLKDHILSVHTDTSQDPRFKCPVCHKYLKQNNSYQKHLMNVHGHGHKCDVCGKMFFNTKVLSLHQRDKHGIDATLF